MISALMAGLPAAEPEPGVRATASGSCSGPGPRGEGPAFSRLTFVVTVWVAGGTEWTDSETGRERTEEKLKYPTMSF